MSSIAHQSLGTLALTSSTTPRPVLRELTKIILRLACDRDKPLRYWCELCLVTPLWLPLGRVELYRQLVFSPEQPFETSRARALFMFGLARTLRHLHRTMFRLNPGLRILVLNLKIHANTVQQLSTVSRLVPLLTANLRELSLSPCPEDLFISAPRLLTLKIDNVGHSNGGFSPDTISNCPSLKGLWLFIQDVGTKHTQSSYQPLLPNLKWVDMRLWSVTGDRDLMLSATGALSLLCARLARRMDHARLLFRFNPNTFDASAVQQVLANLGGALRDIPQLASLQLGDQPFWDLVTPEELHLCDCLPSLNKLSMSGVSHNRLAPHALPHNLRRLELFAYAVFRYRDNTWRTIVASLVQHVPQLVELVVELACTTRGWTSPEIALIDDEGEEESLFLMEESSISAWLGAMLCESPQVRQRAATVRCFCLHTAEVLSAESTRTCRALKIPVKVKSILLRVPSALHLDKCLN